MPEELLSTDPGAADLLSTDPDAATIGDAPPPKKEPDQASVGAAVPSAFATHLLPYVQHAIEAFATSPSVKPAAAKAGRVLGAVTSFPAGITGFGDVAKGAWTGGKAGWFTGKLAQDIVASMADKIEAHWHTLNAAASKAVAATGVGELAQMAEPDRKDIGFLGIGKSVSDDELIERFRKQLLDPNIDKDPQKRAGIVAAINQLKAKGKK